MPAKAAQMTGFEANCLAAADHFIACRGSKPATRIRARFDRIDQAEAFAATFGDSRTMIYAVTAEGRSAHIKNAWAQVDTAQDASWFGTWASPAERTIVNFAEGDVTRTVCDTDAEFAATLREIDRWNRDHGYGPARIDPGFDPALKTAFAALGLIEMIH